MPRARELPRGYRIPKTTFSSPFKASAPGASATLARLPGHNGNLPGRSANPPIAPGGNEQASCNVPGAFPDSDDSDSDADHDADTGPNGRMVIRVPGDSDSDSDPESDNKGPREPWGGLFAQTQALVGHVFGRSRAISHSGPPKQSENAPMEGMSGTTTAHESHVVPVTQPEAGPAAATFPKAIDIIIHLNDNSKYAIGPWSTPPAGFATGRVFVSLGGYPCIPVDVVQAELADSKKRDRPAEDEGNDGDDEADSSFPRKKSRRRSDAPIEEFGRGRGSETALGPQASARRNQDIVTGLSVKVEFTSYEDDEEDVRAKEEEYRAANKFPARALISPPSPIDARLHGSTRLRSWPALPPAKAVSDVKVGQQFRGRF